MPQCITNFGNGALVPGTILITSISDAVHAQPPQVAEHHRRAGGVHDQLSSGRQPSHEYDDDDSQCCCQAIDQCERPRRCRKTRANIKPPIRKAPIAMADISACSIFCFSQPYVRLQRTWRPPHLGQRHGPAPAVGSSDPRRDGIREACPPTMVAPPTPPCCWRHRRAS